MPSLDLELVPALTRALDSDALVLHFQPEVDLASGAVVGMEALLRWQHPQRGLLWPGDFLAVADGAGLMPSLGWWVLEKCVAELESWRPLPPTVDGVRRQMWVNVAGSQLLEPTFVERVARLVGEAALPPGMLGLEVTEEALSTGSRAATELMTSLREAGVALAIDDFGTWYSSLGTLGELPIEAVKLDQSFVRGVGSDLENDSIVSSVIELAHAHGVRVVAEGVESWSEGARLCELGCDRALGYLFSGPQRAEQARLMLAHGTGWQGAGKVPAPRARQPLHPLP
ncbi:MAG TPA: EAL domain-containing protein [Mycobacteriales bacterium]|jgi:EAL domain-containing protein (putative c-di-GMP-specific phosphodiesterase class I)|nr:EAL domain-containing protein [Mycobacteriales bacterium]